MWARLNEDLLLAIWDLLPLGDLFSASLACQWWQVVAFQLDIGWRRRLGRDYGIDTRIGLPPGTKSWRSLYKKWYWQTPNHHDESIQIDDHTEPISFACFSPEGDLLATVGHDAQLFVYETRSLNQSIFEADLGVFHWSKAQKCEFNNNGTMLMVSGVKVPDLMGRALGEMVVFSVQEDWEICARITNKPDDVVGCWYNQKYLISSDFKWLSGTHLVSASLLWLNKVTPLLSESAFDYKLSCMRSLFRFYNPNASCIRHFLVCNAPKSWLSGQMIPTPDEMLNENLLREILARESRVLSQISVPPPTNVPSVPPHIDDSYIAMLRDREFVVEHIPESSNFSYSPSYRETRFSAHDLDQEDLWVYEDDDSDVDEEDWEYFDEAKTRLEESQRPEYLKIDKGHEIINEREKMLIFTTGSMVQVPHQVGVKKMTCVRFREHMDLSEGLKERMEKGRRQTERQRNGSGTAEDIPDWSDYPNLSHMFDHMDVILDFPGRIVGLATSPDSRFLYVSYRAWPKDFVIKSHRDNPPLASVSFCSVIDLESWAEVGSFSAPIPSFTSNSTLKDLAHPSVGTDLMALPWGNEQAGLFDRYWGTRLGTLEHDDVINHVCLEPTLGQMAISVGNDVKVKPGTLDTQRDSFISLLTAKKKALQWVDNPFMVVVYFESKSAVWSPTNSSDPFPSPTLAVHSQSPKIASDTKKVPFVRNQARNRNQTADNVTFLLDNLLKDYDNSLRPNLGGEPLMVEINMQVRSMGPISEVDMCASSMVKNEYEAILLDPLSMSLSILFATTVICIGNPLLAFIFWYEQRDSLSRRTIINLLTGFQCIIAILFNISAMMGVIYQHLFGPFPPFLAILMFVTMRCWAVMAFLAFNQILLLRFLFLANILRVGAVHDEIVATFLVTLNLFNGMWHGLLDLLAMSWHGRRYLLIQGLNPNTSDPRVDAHLPKVATLRCLILASIINHFLLLGILGVRRHRDRTHRWNEEFRDFCYRFLSFFFMCLSFVPSIMTAILSINDFDLVKWAFPVCTFCPLICISVSYSMDCYFRQSWVDRRLSFSGRKNLALSIEMLRKIWKPDTYIYNGRKSYLHTITTPNKFMRLFPNGRVLYSQRLTIKASCQMDLSDFPMDKQRCPLQIGSFGYTINDVIYQWTAGRGVNIASDMKLSQFDLISTPTGNSTTFLNKGQHSTLIVGFHLQRHMGNFVIQVYGPCVLLVVISWVSFWLNREATSDRISLGVTTVLTMTFLGLEARTDLPQVAYATALDYFVFISFMSIFATVTQQYMEEISFIGNNSGYISANSEPQINDFQAEPDEYLEQAFLHHNHYHTSTPSFQDVTYRTLPMVGNHLTGNGKAKTLTFEDNPGLPPQERNILNHHPYGTFYYSKKNGRSGKRPNVLRKSQSMVSKASSQANLANGRRRIRSQNGTSWNSLGRSMTEVTDLSNTGSKVDRWNSAGGELSDLDQCGCKRCVTRALNNPEQALNSVSRIDKISRVVFPLIFLVINIVYWYKYLNHSERIDLSFET
eukprot:maker-scaffold456_size166325-snap-gene-0.27 protein:Tk11181 transcript:maker-scaffold456_size166325-snap-gene-0.27-mRNA-1 annotation:"gaba-gated ion channel grd isoform x2"